MYSDNINYIPFELLESQVELVLRGLELYAYNLHYVGRYSVEDYEQSNILLFHTFNQILATLNTNKIRPNYSIIKNCELEVNRINKKKFYEKKFYKTA